jgi:hypothetical protein
VSHTQRIKRISLLAGTLALYVVVLVLFQSSTQEANTQPARGAAERPSYPTPGNAEFVPGEVIVELEEDATQADLAALNRRADASTEANLPSSDVNLVDLPPDLSVKQAIQRYEASADVENAEPNFLLHPSEKPTGSPNGTPNDDYFDKLWGLHNTGQAIGGQAGTSDADVDGLEAWTTSTSTSTNQRSAQSATGAVVAVIDE